MIIRRGPGEGPDKPWREPRIVFSKLVKSQALAASEALIGHIPELQFYSPQTLEEILQKYSLCFLKPECGLKGQGVISVQNTATGPVIRHEKQVFETANLQGAVSLLDRMLDKERYIVQQGIELLSIHGRPLDFRISIQKPSQRWLFTGIAARLAEPGKIVTNRSSGGTILPFEQALAACGTGDETQIAELCRRIVTLSMAAARVLDECFPGLRELAVDLGLDKTLHPWILEVNTRPSHKLFGMLPDRSMYMTILRHHRKIWRRFR